MRVCALLFRFVIIQLYKLYYWLRRYKRLIFPTEKIKPVYIFINRYISQIVIVTLVFLISFGNLFTSETKAENFGDQSLLFTLASGSDYEGMYVEEGLISAEPQINSYLSSEQVSLAPDNTVKPEETNSLTFTSDSGALVKPEIPSLEAAMPTRTNIIEYTVKDGDTIGTIAQKFGLSQNTILWENNLTARSYIQPGQILKILPTNGISYSIVKGDNLGKIAQKFNSESSKIIEFNRLSDESDIQVGQVLIIPEGKPYAPPLVIKPKLASIKQIFQQPISEEVSDSGTGKLYWPNGCHTLTQYFNWRHVGLDIACPKGTPIHAAEDGVVYKVAYLNTGYGHHVFIDHGNGKTTRYGHMTTIFVKEGETVKRGQEIGLEGSTGMSTGPHLHFEVRINNKPYNPLNYLR
ncbi:MAG: peptidoglycan DD-metalloendopeptidase family protein [Candidatus Parcubacteria bacterium]|nr:peptidoglycan DD-metalloendopeptidase family protein [Candidatus Parcubacteria bacterium]